MFNSESGPHKPSARDTKESSVNSLTNGDKNIDLGSFSTNGVSLGNSSHPENNNKHRSAMYTADEKVLRREELQNQRVTPDAHGLLNTKHSSNAGGFWSYGKNFSTTQTHNISGDAPSPEMEMQNGGFNTVKNPFGWFTGVHSPGNSGKDKNSQNTYAQLGAISSSAQKSGRVKKDGDKFHTGSLAAEKEIGSKNSKKMSKPFITYRVAEEIGFFPRSFSRVFDRFFKQIFFDVENLVIQEYRFYRYLFLTTIQTICILLLVPLFVNFIAKTYLIRPITEYFWNTKQTEIFLNSYEQKHAFQELQDFEEKLYFESLLISTTSENSMKQYNYLPLDLNSGLSQRSAISGDSAYLNSKQEGFSLLGQSFVTSPQEGNVMLGSARTQQTSLEKQEKHSSHDLGSIQEASSKTPQNLKSAEVMTGVGLLPLGNKTVGKTHGDLQLQTDRVTDLTSQGVKAPIAGFYSGADVPNFLDKPALNSKGSSIDSNESLEHRSQRLEGGQSGAGVAYAEKNKVPVFVGTYTHTKSLQNTTLLSSAISVSGETKEEQAVNQMQDPVFESFLSLDKKPESLFVSLADRLQEKTLELAIRYNNHSIESITNFFADFISLISFFYLLIALEIQINITKSFLLEVFFGLDDSKKSLLILILTDLLVGYHSSNLWELFFQFIFNHYGIPETQTGIFLLVATLPVLLDVLFKYLIFRHLNRSSPATVATYHAIIE